MKTAHDLLTVLARHQGRSNGIAVKALAAQMDITDRQVRELRQTVQPVFQDPYASLDPRMRVDRIVAEPLVSLGIGMYPIFLARKYKLPKRVSARMWMNLGLDFVVGVVPIVGLAWKDKPEASAAWLRRFGEHADAFASGWMRIRGARRRRGVDRGFVLSDHADWPSLQRAIAATGAPRVIVTHGSVPVMVRWLAEQGLQAGAFDTDYGGEDDDAQPEAPATTDPDRATGAEPGNDPGADPGADSGAHPAYPR